MTMSVSAWQSIIVLIFFFLTTLVCVFPFHIPVPLPSFFRSSFQELSSTDGSQGREHGRKIRWWRLPVDFVTVPPIAVLLLLAMGVLRGSDVRTGIVGSGGVHPISIMALFLSLAYLSISLDATGLFRFAAFWVAKKGGRSGRKLYLYLYAFFFICGVLVGNDPDVLFGTPFLAYFSQVSGISPPTAWIFGQFAVANIASAVLPPSNPTNLVISEAFDINFTTYAAYTVLPTIAAAAAVYLLIAFVLFTSGKQIPEVIDTAALDAVPVAEAEEALGTPEVGQANIKNHHSPYVVNDKHGAMIGAVLFAVTLIVLVGTSPAKVPVWEITVPPAVIMLIRDAWHDRSHWKSRTAKEITAADSVNAAKSGRENLAPLEGPSLDRTYRTTGMRGRMHAAWHSYKTRLPTVSSVLSRLPLSCVLFAFSMFILVQGLTARGWVDVFANWWAAWIRACSKAGTGSAVVGAIAGMLLISILLCNVCGTNIGTAILLARVLEAWLASAGGHVPHMVRLGSIYALAIGTNFGAVSFSFSASLAGLLWRDILKQKGIRVHQRQFALVNAPVVALAALAAGAVLVAEIYVAGK